jgi:citrate synthase
MSGLIKGLEGVVAVRSAISSIVDSTLTYRGIPFDELVEHASFEEVVYLLWSGDLPDEGQLRELSSALASHRPLPAYVLQEMAAFPPKAVPMDALRTAVSALALGDAEVEDMSPEANRRKAVRLVARVPMAVTAFQRLRNGLKPITPLSELSTGANILYTMTGTIPMPRSAAAMDEALVVYADHELNASTFAARTAASTLSDMYAAVTAGLATLKGPLHGGANQAVMDMLEEIGTAKNVVPYVRAKLAAHERIMGFGHRVYRHGDPRAKHLRKLSKELSELAGETKWYDISVKIEEVVEKEKGLQPNVDFYSASVFHLLGFPKDLFPALFACGRIAGWTAHIMEQYGDNRLIRPRAEYVGPKQRQFTPIEQRSPKAREAGGQH